MKRKFILQSDKYLKILYLLFSIIFFFVLIKSGETFFSVDSWSYLELSKTVFSGDFYKFKFQRSFTTQEISNSFPFGYPILIALFNLFIKNSVISMLVINGIAMLSILYLLKKITLKLNIEVYFIFLTILFSFAFLDEVFAGRSISITILIYLIGINCFISGNRSISFFLLGLVPIFRFDFLSISILTLIYLNFKHNIPLYKNLFFLIGLSPWVIFSIINFNTLWATDNSWVVTSSDQYSYVTDFNTSPENMFTNFSDFAAKLWNNFLKFIGFLLEGLKKFSVISILFLLLSISSFFYFKKNKLFYFLFLVSLSPYILTGYFNMRYFVIHSLIISVYLIYNSKLSLKSQKYFFPLLIICCLFSFYDTYEEYTDPISKIEEKKLIDDLEKQQGDKIFIFNNVWVGSKYSALTMEPAVILPSDYNRLDSIQKNNFLSNLGDHAFIMMK